MGSERCIRDNFNTRPGAITFTDASLSGSYILHPAQQNSADAITKTASYSADTFNVPARTTAVFVIEEAKPAATATTAPVGTDSGSSSTLVIVLGVVAALAGLVFFLFRRRKAYSSYK